MYRKHNHFIFDLDGTLAYTIEDLRDSANRMLDHYGFPNITLEETLKNINCGSKVFIRGVLPEDRQDDDAFVEEAHNVYLGFYSVGYANKTCTYPGVSEGIAYLKSQGARLAVFSNKGDEQTKAIIGKLFPEGTFEIALGFTGEFPHKPSPKGALYIASEVFRVSPDEVVLVGDSNVDMELAANAGMHPVGVNWGYRPKELLESLGAEMILCGENDFHKLIQEH